MNPLNTKSNALLLLTAIIWGFAFVAQRAGMEYVGPFTFNGIRFALGSITLLPFLKRNRTSGSTGVPATTSHHHKYILYGGFITGLVCFLGASLQQIGLVYTTAGKAGFITGLYVVLVPIMGLFFGKRTDTGAWIGAILAAIGLYFLGVTKNFSISIGDFLELLGAFFWAGHVLILGWLAPKVDSVKLAFFQFLTCSLLSLLVAVFREVITLEEIYIAAIPILYGGVFSVGVAYTLQVVAQRKAHPAHAAILLSLESVFAALGGWLILGETLTLRGIIGCALMLAGMLLSQLWNYILATK